MGLCQKNYIGISESESGWVGGKLLFFATYFKKFAILSLSSAVHYIYTKQLCSKKWGGGQVGFEGAGP